MTIRTLYLCYFGLLEPLVQTQVLPYLREIAKSGRKVFLLTFEQNPNQNWTIEQITKQQKEFENEGIHWQLLKYHKKPSVPATIYDIICGALRAWRLVRKEKIDVLHARAHVPLAMVLPVQFLTRRKVIFDIRGLMADEYIDAGIWTNKSFAVRAVKWIERKGIEKADQIVVLTNRMKNHLVESKLRDAESIEVIPCCVDFSRVSDERQQKAERFELIYAGSVTGLYMLREMGQFFNALKAIKRDAFFRVMTGSDSSDVVRIFDELKISRTDYAVERALPKDVLNTMRKAQLAISFRTPTFSQIAASPTKIPEYLAVGLPIVSNAKIGDMDLLIENALVGVVVRQFDRASLDSAAKEVLELLLDTNLPGRCITVARENFDVESTGRKGYLNVYRKIEGNQVG